MTNKHFSIRKRVTLAFIIAILMISQAKLITVEIRTLNIIAIWQIEKVLFVMKIKI